MILELLNCFIIFFKISHLEEMDDNHSEIKISDSSHLNDDIPSVKRGRGRPKGSGKKSEYTKMQKLSHEVSDNPNLSRIESLSSNNLATVSSDTTKSIQRRSQTATLTPKNVNSIEKDEDTTSANITLDKINTKSSNGSSRSRSRANKSEIKGRNSNSKERDECVNDHHYPSHNLYNSLSVASPSSSSTRNRVPIPPPPPHNCEKYETGQIANINVVASMIKTLETGLKNKQPLLLGPADRAFLTMFREWSSQPDLRIALELLKKQRDLVLARFDEIEQNEGEILNGSDVQ